MPRLTDSTTGNKAKSSTRGSVVVTTARELRLDGMASKSHLFQQSRCILRLQLSTMPSSPHVPGQYLGYSQQGTRVLAYLLSSPLDAKVSLEVLEDTAVQYSDGTVLAEQSKSADEKNPIANSSIALWKAFWNWLKSAQTGELPPAKTRFVLYVNKVFSGEFAEKFSGAATLNDAAEAINDVEKWFQKKTSKAAPHENANTAKQEKNADYYLEALLAADRATLCEIVTNFRLELGNGNAQDELGPLVLQKAVRQSLVENVKTYLQGWVKSRIDTLIAKGKPAVISVEEFLNELSSYRRRVDVPTALTSTEPEITKAQIDAELSQIYVQQLDLIGLEVDDKLRAIDHFLRSASDRVQWAANGDVHQKSFDQFRKDLEDFWDITRQQLQLDHQKDPPEVFGKRVYFGCRRCTHSLQGLTTPTHFVQGTFHELADELVIGWHPDYESKLGSGNSEDV